MSQEYTPSATHRATITEPSDGDARTAASIRVPVRDLADEVAFQAAKGAFIARAWGLVQTGGGGPTILAGSGNFSAAYSGSDVEITLGTAMGGSSGALMVTVDSGGSRWRLNGTGTVTSSTKAKFSVYDPSVPGQVNLSSDTMPVMFVLFGASPA